MSSVVNASAKPASPPECRELVQERKMKRRKKSEEEEEEEHNYSKKKKLPSSTMFRSHQGKLP